MRRRGRTTPTGPFGATRSHLNSPNAQSRGCTYHICTYMSVVSSPCPRITILAVMQRHGEIHLHRASSALGRRPSFASLHVWCHRVTMLFFFVLFCSFFSHLISSLLFFSFLFNQLPRQRQQPQRQQPPTCVIIARRSSFLQVTNDLDRTKSNFTLISRGALFFNAENLDTWPCHVQSSPS